MGLGTALSVAVSALRANQAQLDVVSNNIANAETPGFTKKSVSLISAISGDRGAGVRVGDISRAIDTVLQRQMRTEGAAGQYTSITNDMLSRITEMFGSPGADSSFDAVFNKFLSSWQELATSPDAYSAQRNVLNQGQILAQTLNQMTSDVQNLRTDMERKLTDATRRVNVALDGIETVSKQLETVSEGGAAALLDQRDAYVNDLSLLMDIRVVPSGNNLSIYTNSGLALYTGRAGTMQFDDRALLDSNSLYTNDDSRGVGTMTYLTPDGTKIDIFASDYIRSGEIAAYKELRDETLVQFQNRLDALAGSLATALSNENVAGTAITGGQSIDTANMQYGNTITINYTDAAGEPQVLSLMSVEDASILPLSNSATTRPDDTVLGVVLSSGISSVASAVQSALGTGFTVTGSGSTFSIVLSGADPDAALSEVNATITNTGFANNGYGLPFFKDGASGQFYTGAIAGIPQIQGFAGRIAVNSDLSSAPSRLVSYSTSPATLAGDGSRPSDLYNRMTQATQYFSTNTGIGGGDDPFQGTPQNFMRNIIDITGFEKETADRINTGQQIVVNSLVQRFQETSGVNVDREMADLMLIQNSFAASARVMNVIKEMLDRLMSI